MSYTRLCIFLLVVGVHSIANAQVQVVSEPKDDYLLKITRDWSRESVLGDLRERPAGTVDIEVRAWGGYGLTTTHAVVARRAAGRWEAWHAVLVQCGISVPIPVGDTVSEATRAKLVAQARKKCGTTIGDTERGASMFDADTLAVTRLEASSESIDSAWNRAVDARVRSLPPSVPRNWRMMDGFAYVIEVRLSDRYRASVIEHVDKPEVDADRQVKEAFAALISLARPDRE